MIDKKKYILIFSSQLSNVYFFLIDLVLSLNDDYHFFIISKKDIKPLKIKNVTYIDIKFKRKISIFYKIFIFFKILKLFNDINIRLILSITPKVSFIISLVNFFFRYRRIHFYTGQIWYNKSAIKKFIFKFFDKIILNSSYLCFVDSKSQRSFLIKEGFNKNKLKLINKGSICGVDTSIFKKNLLLKIDFRKKHNLNKNTIVFLFIGEN